MAQNTRARDSQRAKVWKALSETPTGGHAHHGSLYTAQVVTDHITKSRYWQKIGGPRYVTLQQRRGFNWTRSGLHITLGLPEDRYETIWELLKSLTFLTLTEDEAYHGRTYARNLLQLTRRFIGDEAYQELRQRYRDEKVKHLRYTPRKHSEQHVADSTARMAALSEGRVEKNVQNLDDNYVV